ncbi:Uncharacterised protein [Enterobacter cloacae]|nr:Uncharacterised protein [Enterobacter cloacae]
MEIIYPARGQFFQQIQGVFEANARDFKLFRRETVANDKRVVRVLAHHLVGNVQHRQREFRAVFAAAAPLVVALVRVRGEELLDQIGIRPVDFDAVEPGLNCAAHGFAELADHAFHLFRGQGNRRGGTVTRRGNGAWANRRATPNQFWVDHTAAVVDLQQGFGAFGLDSVSDFCQPGDFLVVINTNCARERQAEIVNKTALNDDGADAARAGAVVLHQLAGHGAIVITGTGCHRGH